jgi:hypothetical protein
MSTAIGEREVGLFMNALDDVLTECRNFPVQCETLEIILCARRLAQDVR